MGKTYHVYILASARNGTLYTGFTGNLMMRASQHHEGVLEGFTKRHGVKCLVYMEAFEQPEFAIRREKRIKKWPRQWKINLIEENNPQWLNLFETLMN